ncbi:uncharacterized protein LOC113311952 [Papaver somniferum]|uniref:uncharacterized protein LOC113311952 n=1 Tax=Papaver somniferum TaxID=3469 RepID=UPI000E704541|nr:uncharacterized protein LOC113311952 [Papaver somniferum]
MLEKCLLDWGLEDVFGVTLDNISANTKAIDYLKQSMIGWTGAIKRTEYLHIRFLVRCVSHDFALVIKDAVRLYNKSIARIMSVIKDFKRLEKYDRDYKKKYIFEEVESVDVPSHEDLIVLSNSMEDLTFSFSSSSESEMEVNTNPQAKKKTMKKKKQPRHHAPYVDDWRYAKGLVKCLKVFFNATVRFSNATQVTTHTILWEVVLIHEQLVQFRDNVAGSFKENGLEFALERLYEKNKYKVDRVMKRVEEDITRLFEECKSLYAVVEESSTGISVVETSVAVEEQSIEAMLG